MVAGGAQRKTRMPFSRRAIRAPAHSSNAQTLEAHGEPTFLGTSLSRFKRLLQMEVIATSRERRSQQSLPGCSRATSYLDFTQFAISLGSYHYRRGARVSSRSNLAPSDHRANVPCDDGVLRVEHRCCRYLGVVCESGRPFSGSLYWNAAKYALNSGESAKMSIQFEPFGAGSTIVVHNLSRRDLLELPVDEIKELFKVHGSIVFRGFDVDPWLMKSFGM